jgi:CubicO group peptidase (beta-lactamase class C family)
VMGIPIKFGIGYGLLPMPDVLPFLPEDRLCSWGGWGGSLVIADVDRRMTVAYVMNKMALAPGAVGPIVTALVERVYDIVNR